MDNRTLLLESALHLFARHGYDAVGVQEVVEAAGLTKPTLYHYFGSKNGLLRELAQRHGERICQDLEAAATYQGDVPLSVMRVISTTFRLATLFPEYWRLQLGMWFAPSDNEAGAILGPYMVRQLAAIEGMFEAASPDHGAFRGRHARYAVSLHGTLMARVGLYLRGQGELGEELAYLTAHQFMHGIYS